MRKNLYYNLGAIFFVLSLYIIEHCEPGKIIVTPACPSDKTLCGDECVDTATDRNNCGACGNRCGNTQYCVFGECRSECPSGFNLCGDECVDTQKDEDNCGNCGRRCNDGEQCINGECVLNCPQGFTNCNGSCVNLQTDPANCGDCGRRCNSNEVCSNGQCTVNCSSGLTNCNGSCVDLYSDNNNCGTCGRRCNPNERCENGDCIPNCDPGLSLCNSQCVDLNSDPNNCGGCNRTCRSDQICSFGRCICRENLTECNGVCVDTSRDIYNCGRCNNICRTDQICNNGCVCPTGFTDCNGRCVDTMIDPNNCGNCGRVCSGGYVCSNGSCILNCPQGYTDCYGTCVNLQVDPNNCGRCGNVCQSGRCSSGQCETLVSGDTCSNPILITPGIKYTGDTTTANDNYNYNGIGSGGKDVVFQFTLNQTSDVLIHTYWSSFDTVIYLSQNCGSGDRGYNDDAGGSTRSILRVTALSPGTYYLILDGFSSTDYGSFSLLVEASRSSTQGDSFGNPVIISSPTTQTGSTSGRNNFYSPSCAISSAPEYVYFLPVRNTGTYNFSLCGSSYDTVLFIKESSMSQDLSCNDDSSNCGTQSEILGVSLNPGGYFIIVDGYSNYSGNFTLNITGP